MGCCVGEATQGGLSSALGCQGRSRGGYLSKRFASDRGLDSSSDLTSSKLAQLNTQYHRLLGSTLQAEEKLRHSSFELALADTEVERYEKMMAMLDQEMTNIDAM
jgi:hypothetical protein